MDNSDIQSAVSTIILPMIRYYMLLPSKYDCSKWRSPSTTLC